MNTLTLYITRAPLYHTKQFIIDTFLSNRIGIVSDVVFIKQTDYYSDAIVLFERWFINSYVNTFIYQLDSSVNKTTQLIYNDSTRHYWNIQFYNNTAHIQSIRDNIYLQTQVYSLTTELQLLRQESDTDKQILSFIEDQANEMRRIVRHYNSPTSSPTTVSPTNFTPIETLFEED